MSIPAVMSTNDVLAPKGRNDYVSAHGPTRARSRDWPRSTARSLSRIRSFSPKSTDNSSQRSRFQTEPS